MVRASAPDLEPGRRDLALVWIDGREASIVRSQPVGPSIERVFARRPGRAHPTGRLRHDAAARHGEEWKSAAERRREGQLGAFLGEVERRLDPSADVLVIGPGPVHERLARRVEVHDARHGVARTVTVESVGRLTIRQLQARLREASAMTSPGPGASNSSAIR
jgi:hypothetical protein